jgi:hypothetical protein
MANAVTAAQTLPDLAASLAQRRARLLRDAGAGESVESLSELYDRAWRRASVSCNNEAEEAQAVGSWQAPLAAPAAQAAQAVRRVELRDVSVGTSDHSGPESPRGLDAARSAAMQRFLSEHLDKAKEQQHLIEKRLSARNLKRGEASHSRTSSSRSSSRSSSSSGGDDSHDSGSAYSLARPWDGVALPVAGLRDLRAQRDVDDDPLMVECVTCGRWVVAKSQRGGIAVGYCCHNVLVSRVD